jgi:hypothetical protein
VTSTAVPESDRTRTAGTVATTLRALLATQLGRLRRRYLVHGLAIAVALVAAAILFAFALDRTIDLPAPIRLFHTALVVALLAFALVRYVRYPLSRRFGEVDLAVWFERTFPELHQRLVSALQLHDVADAELRNQSRPMIDALLRETEATVRTLPAERLFDPRPTRRALAAATALAAVLAAGAWLSPATVRAFLLRHLGVAVSYPRETTLRVELPPGGADLQRSDDGPVTELVLPAGADLHVSVLAEGRVPKEVFLDVQTRRVDGGTSEQRAVAMSPRPGDRFRHVFRRVAGSFEFHARGGDDDEGDRRVVVRTVSPPQVAGVTAIVHPPAYTGIAAIEQQNAIEALVGSDVDVAVATTLAVRSATMVFLESGRRLELAPGTPQDDSGVAASWRGRFAVTVSDRFQIELVADNGLRNPNPGTYPLSALQDYAPIGRWLLPDDEGLLLLPTALLCVRVDAHDDFGLAAVDLRIERAGEAAIERPLLATTTPPVTDAVTTELLEVRELVGTGAGSDGLSLLLSLRDNKQPQPGRTELPRRIVQVVDEQQLAAAIARAFRGLREDMTQALDVQVDRRGKLEDLMQRAGDGTIDVAQALTGVEVGQGRVASALDRAHRALMRAFDVHLWNRLEPSPNAVQVVDLYRERARALTEPLALDPEFYREVARRRASGALGAMENALDPLLSMLATADDTSRGASTDVARALAEAQVARDPAERHRLLAQAHAGQQLVETALQRLLAELERWNDYQDLIQDTRSLRDLQRMLQDKTEEVRGKR